MEVNMADNRSVNFDFFSEQSVGAENDFYFPVSFYCARFYSQN